MFGWLTERRRRRILEAPFPDAWRDVLERRVAAYRLLDDAERARLRDLAQVMVEEKHWEGCGGLELGDEHRVTIAGQACLLLLGRDHALFDDVGSIFVYPSSVVLPARQPGVFERQPTAPVGDVAIDGLAGRDAPIVLAWDAVVVGGLDAHDGRNVVLHEFAHKIDMLDGRADGAPPLRGAERARVWADVCQRAFDALERKVELDKPTGVLRAYGATNPAEFFAVATEAFFEKPRRLADEEHELYAVMADFYGLDLATRAKP